MAKPINWHNVKWSDQFEKFHGHHFKQKDKKPMANRYRLLDNFSVEDISSGKQFNPLKDSNRAQAEKLAEGGDYELLEIINQLELDGNSYQSRKANDVDVTGLLESLKGEVALEKALADAQVYISQRGYDLEKLGMTKKGESLAKASKRLEDMELGTLQGNVPMPIMVKQQGKRREHRLHTDYEINPITGEQQVIPYMDPTNRKKTLRTYFGEMDDNLQGHYDMASEYIGAQALKLAGKRAVANNQDMVTDRFGRSKPAYWRADLKDVDDPMKGQIDVERGDASLDRHTLPTQITAVMDVNDADWNSGLPIDKRGELALAKFINENPDVKNLMDAAYRIRDSGIVRDVPDDFYLGKGFKAIKGPKEDRMHKILSVLGTSRKDKNMNGSTGFATPVTDLNLIDPAVGMALVEELGRDGIVARGNKTNIKVPHYHSKWYRDGAGGRGGPRDKVKINLPKGMKAGVDNSTYGVKEGDEYSTNLLEDSPLTQQLLTTELMKLRMK